MDSRTRRFWLAYLDTLANPSAAHARFFEVFRVGLSAKNADQGAELILSGTKTSTSSLHCEYEALSKRLPEVDSLSILADGRGAPVCVVQTDEVEVKPFSDVDAQFAYDYGEWDRTLETWREHCWSYYAEQCAYLGITPSEDMLLVCERFSVIYTGAAADDTGTG